MEPSDGRSGRITIESRAEAFDWNVEFFGNYAPFSVLSRFIGVYSFDNPFLDVPVGFWHSSVE